MENTSGLFFARQKGNLTDCYIVINHNLYNDDSSLEKAKLVSVHEFCHFIALIYSLTATTIKRQQVALCKRLSKKIDELNTDTINRFYIELSKSEENAIRTAEFDDDHFRLGLEGKTVDYDILFKHFLLSKELFEEYFTVEKQKEFHVLINSPEEELRHKALLLFINEVDKVSKEKSILREFAFKQALSWVKKYLK